MDPQALRLVELWQQSLEEGLNAARQMEFDDLLAKPDLAQGLADWQAERSPLEDPGSADYGAMDERVIRRLRNRALWDRYKPHVMGTGLGFLVLLGFWLGRPGDAPQAVAQSQAQFTLVDNTVPTPAPVERKPVSHAAATPKRGHRVGGAEAGEPEAALSLPPGYGERPRSLQRRDVERLRVDWALNGNGRAEVLVLNAEGQAVRLLWRGQAGAGGHASYWDGSINGQAAKPGRYRLVVRSDGREIASQGTEILAP